MHFIRKISILLLLLGVVVQMQAQDQYAWVEKTSIPTVGRHRACGCAVGNRGYVGLGHISNTTGNIIYNDWWEYDPGTDSWMQKANFAPGTRYHAIAFSLGNYAFVGTGTDGTFSDRDDMWKYSPANNSWTPVANVPGGPRSGAFAFTINGKGYVALGDYQTDCEEYDPVANAWTTKAPALAGGYSTVGAVYNGKCYMGVGQNQQWQSFDPLTNSWQMLPSFPGITRFGSGSFEYNGWIYVISGSDWVTEYSDSWAYNPVTNQWVQISNFPGQARHYFVCFTIGNRVYGGTGTSGTNYHDWWEYGELSGINEVQEKNAVTVFPNPIVDKAEFDFKNELTTTAIFTLYDAQGKKIKEENISPCDFWMFDRETISSGIYSYSIISHNTILSTGKLVLQ